MQLDITIALPGVTEAEAREAVRALDIADAGLADAIDLDKVRAADVLEALMSGRWSPHYLVTSDTMSDA